MFAWGDCIDVKVRSCQKFPKTVLYSMKMKKVRVTNSGVINFYLSQGWLLESKGGLKIVDMYVIIFNEFKLTLVLPF